MALAMNTMNITATACILAVDLGKYKSVACLYPWVKMGYAIIPPNPDEEIPVNEATRA